MAVKASKRGGGAYSTTTTLLGEASCYGLENDAKFGHSTRRNFDAGCIRGMDGWMDGRVLGRKEDRKGIGSCTERFPSSD